MKYAIYFTWKDGSSDTFNCEDRKDRDDNIHSLIHTHDVDSICYSKIYKSGEYGKRYYILKGVEM